MYISQNNHSMRKLFFFGFIIFTINSDFLYSQAPGIQWQKCYGDTLIEYGSCIRPTNDGGYITIGSAFSHSGDVSDNHDTTGVHSDVWVLKLDSNGNIQWKKCYGGTDDDVGSFIAQTHDSGYIVCATTNSTDGDVTGNHGRSDIWILKLDTIGNIEWEKCYGGTWEDKCNYIQEINYDGYIIAAQSSSDDGNLPGHHGTAGLKWDAWVLKLNGIGNIDWSRNFGGTDDDHALSGLLAYDGGFIFGCRTFSIDGDVIGNHGLSDSWLIKLDYFGNLEWKKCFGGTNIESGIASLQRTDDLGYILATSSSSNNGNVSGNHGQDDFWIVKTDSNGTIIWQTCYGGTATEVVSSISSTDDGGYIIGGFTLSNNGDVMGKHGPSNTYDYWLVKIDSTGIINWQKCLGSDSYEAGCFVEQTNDRGFIVGGTTNTPIDNGDVTGNHGTSSDYWIVKLFPAPVGVNEIELIKKQFTVYPNPGTKLINIKSKSVEFNKIVVVNVIGEEIINFSCALTKNFNLEIENLKPGVYFFNITTKVGIVSKSFIKL
jgi:hypothetical protein